MDSSMDDAAQITHDNSGICEPGDDVLSPPTGWESVLWRALVSVGLLVAGLTLGRYSGDSGDIISKLFSLAAALIVSVPLFYSGIRGLFSDNPSAALDQLAGLAVLAAMVQADFTTAVIVGLTLSLGHLAEERGIRRAGAAIESLVKLTSRTAHKITGSGEVDLPSEELATGDNVAVYPGEVIPADGVVEFGYSAIDPAHLTGESTPVDVGPEDKVFHGTINLTGRINVEVEKSGSDTSLGHVIEALGQAEASRPPIIRTLERYAGLLLPIVILIAAATFVITREADRAIAILIVACPCALVLSSPAAMVPALAVAVRKGILIKGCAFLERAANIGTLILDKTGTITLGELSVRNYVPAESVDIRELVKAAELAASGSHHPVSKAIARGSDHTIDAITEEIPGKGVLAKTNGSKIRLGRLEWVSTESTIDIKLKETAGRHSGPAAWVSRDGVLLGLVLLADQPRPDVKTALDRMKSLGINRRVLLTGDRVDVANALADQIEFDRIEAELLPEAKNDIVEEEMEALKVSTAAGNRGKGIMFVGDGVNDALALSRADVGVALGAMGSEVALQSADVALMTNDMMLLPFLVSLSRRVHSTIRTNVYVGVSFSVLMLLLAILGVISPIWGAILHHGGTLFVIGNSMRLLNEERESLP